MTSVIPIKQKTSGKHTIPIKGDVKDRPIIPSKEDLNEQEHHVPTKPADYYTKPQVDGLLSFKADKSELEEEVDRAINVESSLRSDLDIHEQDDIKHITEEERITWNSKQNHLTAGLGIHIIDDVISTNVANPSWGSIIGNIADQTDLKNQLDILDDSIYDIGDDLSDHMLDTVSHVTSTEKSTWDNKQDKLTAGENITIQDNVISATAGGNVDDVQVMVLLLLQIK